MGKFDDIVLEAIERGKKAASLEPRAVAAHFDAMRQRLTIELSSGAELTVSPLVLGLAGNADLSDVQVVGGGFDLYFPRIDEGAFVPDVCLYALQLKQAA